MIQFRRRFRLLAVGAALSLALVACGGGGEAADSETTTDTTESEMDDTDTEPETEEADEGGELAVEPASSGDPFVDLKAAADHVTMTAPVLAGGIATAADMGGNVDAEAAQLRQGLTSILQQHVYEAGIAVDIGLTFGLDSDEFALAADALDTNSVKLADTVASVAGDDSRDPFLQLWRDHIGFFVDYAGARAGDDDQAAQQAQDDLSGYTQDAGAFFEEVTGGELPQDAVAGSLQMHIDTLSAAIESAAAGEASVFDNLKGASDHIVESSAVLAGGIAAATGAGGNSDSDAAGLSAGLTGLLQEHTYLAGIAVKTAYAAGPDSDAFNAAAETLDTNSQELAAAVESFTSAEDGEAFLQLWRDHIGFFVDYAVATAGDDEEGRTEAIESLAGYTTDAGAFFEDNTGGELPAGDVAASLEEHIATLAGAIDSLAGVEFPDNG